MLPTERGQCDHHIIMEYQQSQDMLNGDRNLGCKSLIEDDLELFSSFEISNNPVVVDLDTPEEYAGLTCVEVVVS